MEPIAGLLACAMIQTTIPCIDLDHFLTADENSKKQFVEEFGTAMEKIGCVAIKNSGISITEQEDALTASKHYFQLPLEEKMRAYTGNGLQGYVPFQQEHAKNYSIGDLKEYYHLTGTSMPEHLWPKSQPQFKEKMLSFYDACDVLTRELLVALGLYLKCDDEKVLANLIGEGSSILRVLHYPAVDLEEAKAGAVRSHEHEDINLMTIMPKASAPGLQIKTKTGVWIDVIVPDHTVIVTPSELMGHITNQRISATTHRVVNPQEGDSSERYSFPFFTSPPLDKMLPLLDAESKIRGYVLHSDLLAKRLREIGAKTDG
jgi:isopenicillin N synthase-like dioxygenase